MPPKDAKQGKGGGKGKETAQVKDAKQRPQSAQSKDAKQRPQSTQSGRPGESKGAQSAAPQVDKKQKKAEKAQAEAERRAAAERMFDISDESDSEEEEAEDEGVEQAASKVSELRVEETSAKKGSETEDNEAPRRQEAAAKYAVRKEDTDRRQASASTQDKRLKEKERRQGSENALSTNVGTLEAFSVTMAGSISAMKAAMEGEKRAVKDIILDDFSISLPGRVLYSNATLKLTHGHRYGFLGPNGHGKSTLMRFLAEKKLPVPGDMRIVLVEQEGEGDERSAIQSLLSCDEEREQLLLEEEELLCRVEREQGDDGTLEEDLKRLEAVEKQLQQIGAAGAEAKARKILAGLGFSDAMMDKSVQELSGGWRKRVALARGLYSQPDLLLLDEPTNHLDLEAVLWLSTYLSTYPGTLLVVSHDQAFLEDVATDILVLAKQRVRLYRGGYEQYTLGAMQEEAEGSKRWKKQEDTLKREMAKGKSKQEVMEALRKEAERTGSQLAEEPSKVYRVQFKFSDPANDGPACSLHHVTFGYDRTKTALIREVSCNLAPHSRVAVMGSNGCGKSTLLKLVAGREKPWDGEVCHGAGLRVGYYSQHLDFPADVSAVDWLCSQPGCKDTQQARKTLGHFGLPGGHHVTPLGTLSGGQRARVGLSAVSVMKGHLLVLDEPTNHLDVESIQGLTEGLKAFEGGVVLVSHDMRLLRELEPEVWVVKDGQRLEEPGGCEGYRRRVLKEVAEREARAERAAETRERERRARREQARKAAASARAS